MNFNKKIYIYYYSPLGEYINFFLKKIPCKILKVLIFRENITMSN